MAGGEARVRPVPVTDQDLRLKAVVTARPRRPLAPVMRAVWEDIVVGGCCGWVGRVGGWFEVEMEGLYGRSGRDGMMSRCWVYFCSFVWFKVHRLFEVTLN